MGTLAPSKLCIIHKCLKECFMYLKIIKNFHIRMVFKGVLECLKGSWSALRTSCICLHARSSSH